MSDLVDAPFFLQILPKGPRRFQLRKRIDQWPGDTVIRLCDTKKEAILTYRMIAAETPEAADPIAAELFTRERKQWERRGSGPYDPSDAAWTSIAVYWKWIERPPASFAPLHRAGAATAEPNPEDRIRAWLLVMRAARGLPTK